MERVKTICAHNTVVTIALGTPIFFLRPLHWPEDIPEWISYLPNRVPWTGYNTGMSI